MTTCDKHYFDETGHCFECDMPKAEHLARMAREGMQRLRVKKRKTLVPLEIWIKPANKQQLLDYIKELEK